MNLNRIEVGVNLTFAVDLSDSNSLVCLGLAAPARHRGRVGNNINPVAGSCASKGV